MGAKLADGTIVVFILFIILSMGFLDDITTWSVKSMVRWNGVIVLAIIILYTLGSIVELFL
jgi:hypothetical protein